jgi:hypothetical protein
MEQFQPGEAVHIDLVFRNPVPIDDAYVVFVHEQDENEHILFGLQARYKDEPLPPSYETTIKGFKVLIAKDTKPGVYALDEINFNTFGGKTLGYQADFLETPKFEVIPERAVAPIVVADISIKRS